MRLLRRTLDWLEDRTGLVSVTKSVMDHPVPPGAKWWYVFGSATLLCFIILVTTGIILATMYVPAPNQAYQSLQFITHQAAFGRFIRGLHSWAATGMVIMVGIHLIQVFLFAAYKYPREMNWITGVLLLAVTLSMAFTGQILRWDDNGVWTTVVLVNMVGRVPFIGDRLAHFLLAGDVVNASTLSHFFTYHVFVIPALIFIFVGLHLYLVIRNGISEPPQAGRPVEPKSYRAWYNAMLHREGVPFWPDALWRDALFALVVVGALAALAIFAGPPALGAQPSPADVNTNPRPDWYFLWLFAALALLPPNVEFALLIGGSLLFFVILFVLPFFSYKGERSWKRRPWAPAIVGLSLVTVTALTVLGLKAPWSPQFASTSVPKSAIPVSDLAAQQGAQLFAAKGCIYCHAIGGVGGQRGPDLSAVGDRLDANQLTWRIANGGVNMPAFAGTLSSDQIHQLVAFLAAQRGRQAGGAQP